MVSGGSSGGVLDFSNDGKADIVGTATEPKFGEEPFCGRTFYRAIGSGVKLCKACEQKRTRIRKVN